MSIIFPGPGNVDRNAGYDDEVSVKTDASASSQEATGSSSIRDSIHGNYTEAKNILEDLLQQIFKNKEYIEELHGKADGLTAKIIDLKNKINDLPDGEQKVKAQKDLDAANDALEKLNKTIGTAKSELQGIEGDMENFKAIVEQLGKFAALENPTQEHLDKVNEYMNTVRAIQDKERRGLQNTLSTANRELGNVESVIQTIQADLRSVINAPINDNYRAAEKLLEDFIKKIAESQANIDRLLGVKEDLGNKIADLKRQVEALSNDDPRKIQAQKDLEYAYQSLAEVGNQIAQAQSVLGNVQGELGAINETLEKLRQLSELENPTQGDLDRAIEYLKSLQGIQKGADNALKNAFSLVDKQIVAVEEAIKFVGKDLTAHTQVVKNRYDESFLKALQSLTQQMLKDQNSVNDLSAKEEELRRNIANLKSQINSLPDGDPAKVEAQKNLERATESLLNLGQLIRKALSGLDLTRTQIAKLESYGPELEKISSTNNPSQKDLDQLNQYIGILESVQKQYKDLVQESVRLSNREFANTNREIANTNKIIQK